jgi:hypothetical protein
MDIKKFIEICGEQGIEIKWFGASEPIAFTSRYDSWNYIKDTADLPHTLTILATLCDMRVPLTFNTEDCALIADIISEVVAEIKQI